jgi:Fe-S-cluster containining protein
MEPDPVRELERQVEAGNMFSHAVLATQGQRADQNEAIIRGLVDLLIARDVIDPQELVAAVDEVRTQTDIGVAIRVDKPAAAHADSPPIDCAARLHLCHAVCCRLRFPLTVEEVEAGVMKWDLGRPYFNRHGPDGYCTQCDSETHACGIYEDRPTPCREYSCADDERIWKDFEAMEINQEWIDERLGTGPGPVEIFMSAEEADSRPAA